VNYLLTVSLKALPALKIGTVDAGILISCFNSKKWNAEVKKFLKLIFLLVIIVLIRKMLYNLFNPFLWGNLGKEEINIWHLTI